MVWVCRFSTCFDDGIFYEDAFGATDMNSIGVRTGFRGGDGQLGSFHVGASPERNMHLLAIFHHEVLDYQVLAGTKEQGL